jgi:branched-chain amino acid transport system permease protein
VSYLLSGCVIGGVYAIFALGLLLTYRSSRVFNFGQAAMAYFAARLFYYLAVTLAWNRFLAAAFTVLICLPALGLLLWAALYRHLGRRTNLIRIVSTIGVLVALPAITDIIFGEAALYNIPGLGGFPPKVYSIFGNPLDANGVAVLIATLVVASGFGALIRLTNFGLLIRAVVDSPETTSLTGLNPTIVSAGTWAMGSALAGLAGILVAPIVGLSDASFEEVVIGAFAAVVIARLSSFVVTFFAAIVVGILQQSSISFVPSGGSLSGLTTAAPFLIMVVVLLVYSYRENLRLAARAGQLVAGSTAGAHDFVGRVKGRVATTSELANTSRGFFIVFAIVFGLLGISSAYWSETVGTGLILGVIFLSFTLVTGEAGLITLCQSGIAGIGAITLGQVATEIWHLPIVIAFALGGVAGALVATVLGALCMRLGDLYFALMTIGFALLMDDLVLSQQRFQDFSNGVAIPVLKIGGYSIFSGRLFVVFMAIIVAIGSVYIIKLRKSTGGMVMAAVRAGEDRAESLGINSVRIRMTAFALAGLFAGIGGAFYAAGEFRALPNDYLSTVGIVWFAIVMTLGARSIGGAIAAGITATVIPSIIAAHLSGVWLELPTALFGLGAVALAREPAGGAATMTRQLTSLRLKLMRKNGQSPEPEVPEIETAVASDTRGLDQSVV